MKEPESVQYFTQVVEEDNADEGTRDMHPLAPFLISGGENTERYYFIHVNELSDKYSFNIIPKYFGEESAYTEVFPNRIKEILSKNAGAKVFCVFDMDTVVEKTTKEKHTKFVESLRPMIDRGEVVLCDSMPSFEFWLLLHFTDYEAFLKNYSEVSNVLAPYLKPYFENPNKSFKKLIKSKKYLENSNWVKRILHEGRLEQAIRRAKLCNERSIDEGERHSYSNVFKAFIG